MLVITKRKKFADIFQPVLSLGKNIAVLTEKGICYEKIQYYFPQRVCFIDIDSYTETEITDLLEQLSVKERFLACFIVSEHEFNPKYRKYAAMDYRLGDLQHLLTDHLEWSYRMLQSFFNMVLKCNSSFQDNLSVIALMIAKNDEEYMLMLCDEIAESYCKNRQKKGERDTVGKETCTLKSIQEICDRILQYLFLQVPYLQKYIPPIQYDVYIGSGEKFDVQLKEWSTNLLNICRKLMPTHTNSNIFFYQKYMLETEEWYFQTLDEQVEQFGMSKYHFERLFKEHVGIGIKEYGMQLRLMRACVLLADENMKIKNVAEMLGFTSAEYFRKCFRKKYGISPMDYHIRFAQEKRYLEVENENS